MERIVIASNMLTFVEYNKQVSPLLLAPPSSVSTLIGVGRGGDYFGFTMQEYAERFWSKVDKRGPDECWEWLAGKKRGGYGQFWLNGCNPPAHRVVWLLTYVSIPDDLFVRHRCDNPSCVNPAHLWLGTTADNTRDRNLKGRQAMGETHGSKTHPEKLSRGEKHHAAKITEEQVRKIRASTTSSRKTAKRYRVSHTVICNTRKRESWRHVA